MSQPEQSQVPEDHPRKQKERRASQVQLARRTKELVYRTRAMLRFHVRPPLGDEEDEEGRNDCRVEKQTTSWLVKEKSRRGMPRRFYG